MSCFGLIKCFEVMVAFQLVFFLLSVLSSWDR